MKICIDIQAAIAQHAGVGRYTRELVRHLWSLREDNLVSLFYFDFRRRNMFPEYPGITQKAIRWCPGRVIQKCWKTFQWPPFNWFAGHADIYHFPNFVLPPLSSGKKVVTIHDVSFILFPDFAESVNLAWLKKHIKNTINNADAIITDSQLSARDITEHLSAKPEKLFPIYPGISERFATSKPDAIEHMREKYGINRPYILTVSTIEPRKNIEFLVTVFERMKQFDGYLVIAGRRGWKYRSILRRMKNSPRAQNIRYIEYVRDDELPALYSGAELFLFPSLYEGFGFPPLEAASCGTAVLASSAGSLGEVLSGGALILNNFDAEEWASQAYTLISNNSMRQALSEKGRKKAATYNWQETARKTWDVYKKVV